MIKPYWTSPDGMIVVYNERWEDVLAAGLVPVDEVALIHDDPPYGIDVATKKRSGAGRVGKRGGVAYGRSWSPIVGDREPYDPAPLLALSRPFVTWGANHYASRLPDSSSWLWWDKRDTQPEIANACGELAWTNLGGPARRFMYLWSGLLRASSPGGKGGDGRPCVAPHLHPTEKPVALCAWVYRRAKLKRGDLVFVPHMGSGPDLPVCVAMGLRCIAVEVSRDYCDTAIARLGAVTAERAAEPVGSLFAPRGAP